MPSLAPKLSVDLGGVAAALALEWRLQHIPDTAKTRGMFFNSLGAELERRRLLRMPELARIFSVPRTSYSLYPVRDIVEACAFAGALVDDDPREGMRRLFLRNTEYVTSTWFGQIFSKYLRPYDALRWLERSREYVANYGVWRLESRGDGHAVMHKYDEYVWLDAYRGACEGMLELCGVQGEVRCELDSPFSGRLVITWDPRR